MSSLVLRCIRVDASVVALWRTQQKERAFQSPEHPWSILIPTNCVLARLSGGVRRYLFPSIMRLHNPCGFCLPCYCGMGSTSLPTVIEMLTNTLAKEVQATIYIPTVSQYLIGFRRSRIGLFLGHYESYLTHLEWIIQAFTLQYPHSVLDIFGNQIFLLFENSCQNIFGNILSSDFFPIFFFF